MVSGRDADHPTLALLGREGAHPVERAASLEGACPLEQLGLEVPARAEAPGAEGRCPMCRAPDRGCRAGDVVGRDGRAGHRVIVVDRRTSENARVDEEQPTPDPHRRHRRPRAVTGHGLLPPAPRHPTPARRAPLGHRGVRGDDHPLDRARRRGEGAAHAAGVRGVVPPLRHSGERVHPSRSRAVSVLWQARRGIRSTSRSTSPPGSRAAGLPHGSCSRSRPSSSLRYSAAG